jgi:hypothetical protein
MSVTYINSVLFYSCKQKFFAIQILPMAKVNTGKKSFSVHDSICLWKVFYICSMTTIIVFKIIIIIIIIIIQNISSGCSVKLIHIATRKP